MVSYGTYVAGEKLNALKRGSDKRLSSAIKAYMYSFYQFTQEAYLFENAADLSVKELPYTDGHMDYSDLYVMDWEENWTFVMTHETDCGPYFIQK